MESVENSFVVYGLIDPRNQQLRYVGLTTRDISRRMEQHLRNNPTGKSHKNSWVRGLKAAGLSPEVEILERCTSWEDLQESERFWIQYYRALGCALVNHTIGGEGSYGFRHTAETRALLADLSRGNKNRVGYKCSGSTIEKMSAANLGRTHTPETREKIGAANRGKKYSAERIRATVEGRRLARLRREEAAKCLPLNSVG